MNNAAKNLIRELVSKDIERITNVRKEKYSKKIEKETTKLLNSNKELLVAAKELAKARKAQQRAETKASEAFDKFCSKIPLGESSYSMGVNKYTTDPVQNITDKFAEKAESNVIPEEFWKEIAELRANAFLRIELASSVKAMREAVEFLKEIGIEIELPI